MSSCQFYTTNRQWHQSGQEVFSWDTLSWVWPKYSPCWWGKCLKSPKTVSIWDTWGEAFQWPNIQCWLGFMVYTKTNHEICPWAWYLNIRMVFGPASVILLLRVVSDFLRMGFDLEVWYAWLGFDFGSGEPTDTRVDGWNLAEISLKDPKFSLLRVKMSEISLSGTRRILDRFSLRQLSVCDPKNNSA